MIDLLLKIAFIFLWASAFVAAKLGLSDAGPFSMLAIRFVIVSFIFATIVFLFRAKWPKKNEILYIGLVGILLHGFYLGGVFFSITKGTSAGISSLIVSLHPVLTCILATLIIKEDIKVDKWIGIGLGFIKSYYNEKNIMILDEAFSRVTKDGAFTEGGHYSQYVIECFDRTGVLFDYWFGESDNLTLKDSYTHLSTNIGKVKTWQRRIADTDGVMAVIGDGWHEKIFPGVENGVFYYKDMTIYRESNWLVIKNHRQHPFSRSLPSKDRFRGHIITIG